MKFKRVLIGRESDLPPVHSGLEECFAIRPSFSSPGNLRVETESRALNLDTFSIPEILFLESHHVPADHPHWRAPTFPEFRKHGNGQPYLSLAATTEATFTKRDSEARTLRTSLECLSRYPVALPVGVVAHDVGQAQRTEHGAHPLHASADRAGNLAWVQFLVLCQQFNNCERDRIAE